MQHHLGIGGRLHDRALAHELTAERETIGEVAVMTDGEAAAVEFGEQGLHVAQDRVARGGIARVTDGGAAGQAVDHLAPREVVADEAEAALEVKTLAVVGDDARRLLAAMLEGVQAERGDGGGILMVEDAEHAALLAQGVAVDLEVEIVRLARPCFVFGCAHPRPPPGLLASYSAGTFEKLLEALPVIALVAGIRIATGDARGRHT